MTFPTPTGQNTASPFLTDPNAWAKQPTTDATEARAVAIVTQKEGSKVGAAFKTWYDQARKQDPSVTPEQATDAFLTGYSVATASGQELQLDIGTVQAATNAAEDLYQNPLFALAAYLGEFAAGLEWFWGELVKWQLWASIGWALLWAILLLSGVYLFLRKQGLAPPIPKVLPIPI